MNDNRLNRKLQNIVDRHNQILEYQFYNKTVLDNNKSLEEKDEEDTGEDELDMDDIEGEDQESGNDEQGDDEFSDENLEGNEEGGEEETPEEPAEEPSDNTEEIDVTNLVNSTEELEQTTQNVQNVLNNATERINKLFDKIGNIENSIGKMDNVLNKVDQVNKQIELMQPPTPEEKLEALADDSYPYNVRLKDYADDYSEKENTQTDLEKKDKKKLTFKDIMADYNENQVRQTFDIPTGRGDGSF